MTDMPPSAPRLLRSVCICNAWWIQTETKPGDFHDPENKYPKTALGLKQRVMHNGCPVHNGHSNRCQPPDMLS